METYRFAQFLGIIDRHDDHVLVRFVGTESGLCPAFIEEWCPVVDDTYDLEAPLAEGTLVRLHYSVDQDWSLGFTGFEVAA